MKTVTLVVVIVLMMVCFAYAGDKTPGYYKELKRSLPCNGHVEGPIFLQTLFPDANMEQYACWHDLDGDGNPDVALIYVFNPNDNAFELIRAMRMIEYFDVLENERSLK